MAATVRSCSNALLVRSQKAGCRVSSAYCAASDVHPFKSGSREISFDGCRLVNASGIERDGSGARAAAGVLLVLACSPLNDIEVLANPLCAESIVVAIDLAAAVTLLTLHARPTAIRSI